MVRKCGICRGDYVGTSSSCLLQADIDALHAAGVTLHKSRSDAASSFAHSKCVARALGHGTSDHRGWNEAAFRDYVAIGDALMYDDVGRVHGHKVAESVYDELSEEAAKVLMSREFRKQAHNRSDDRLDRTSCTLYAEVFGSGRLDGDGVFKILGCVGVANNEAVFNRTKNLLSLNTYDADKMYEGIKDKWSNGIGSRAYLFLMQYSKKDKNKERRNIKWGACLWLRDVVCPALKAGGAEALWDASRTSSNAEVSNKAVEKKFTELFGTPPVVQTVMLRHLGTVTMGDPRGLLYDRRACCTVLDGAGTRALDVIVPPSLGTKEQRLRGLWLRADAESNSALQSYLPKADPQTIEHRCCERGKLRARKIEMLRAVARPAEIHRASLRSFWHILAPEAPSMPPAATSITALCAPEPPLAEQVMPPEVPSMPPAIAVPPRAEKAASIMPPQVPSLLPATASSVSMPQESAPAVGTPPCAACPSSLDLSRSLPRQIAQVATPCSSKRQSTQDEAGPRCKAPRLIHEEVHRELQLLLRSLQGRAGPDYLEQAFLHEAMGTAVMLLARPDLMKAGGLRMSFSMTVWAAALMGVGFALKTVRESHEDQKCAKDAWAHLNSHEQQQAKHCTCKIMMAL
jgi:hypothetical protein